jgi:putative ABC transport system permease protein
MVLAVVKARGSAFIPRLDDVSLSGNTLWWLAGLGAASALILTGGALMTASSRPTELDRALRSSGRSVTVSRAARRVRHGLIAAEFAITVPILVAAVLVTTSLVRLGRVQVGIETARVLTMGVSLAGQRYARDGSRAEFWTRALERIRALPGVESAALSDSRPPLRTRIGNNFELEDHPTPPGQSQPSTPWAFVSTDYFSTVRLRLERGRLFDEHSAQDRELIVDQAWAKRFFPGEAAVGRRLRHGGCINPSCQPWTVVGVVHTVKWQGLDATDEGVVYVPLVDMSSAYVVLRAHADPAALVPSVRRVIKDLDPSLAVRDIATGDDAANVGLAGGQLRAHGAPHRARGDLWRNESLRAAAHARTRHPPRARRTTRRRPAPGDCARRARHRRGPADRTLRRGRGHAPVRLATLRHHADRSGRWACLGGRALARIRSHRVRPSRAPGQPPQSRGAAAGVIYSS